MMRGLALVTTVAMAAAMSAMIGCTPAGMNADGTPDFSSQMPAAFKDMRGTQERQYQQMYSTVESGEADLQAAMASDTDAVKQSSRYASLSGRNQALVDRVKRDVTQHDDLVAWADTVQSATQADLSRLSNGYTQLMSDMVQATQTVTTLRSDHQSMVNFAGMGVGPDGKPLPAGH